MESDLECKVQGNRPLSMAQILNISQNKGVPYRKMQQFTPLNQPNNLILISHDFHVTQANI